MLTVIAGVVRSVFTFFHVWYLINLVDFIKGKKRFISDY